MPKLSATRLTKTAVEAIPKGKYGWDSEVRGFGVRVTPAGSRTFIFRYKVSAGQPGAKASKRQRYEPIGPFPSLTVEAARDRAKVLAGQIDKDHRGEREDHALRVRNAKTVADLETLYLGDYAKTRGLRPKTLYAAREGFRLVPPDIKAMAVEAVAKPDIRALHGAAKERAGLYQANRLLGLLSKAFSLAEEQGWRTTVNPCKGIKKYPEDQRWRNLSEPEVARLLDACDSYDANPDTAAGVANAIRLLLFTGARLREVIRAEWVQFDLDRGIWEKPSAHTKTKLQHRLEIAGEALDLLKAMREENPKGLYLFAGEPLVGPLGQLTDRPRSDLKRPWDWIKKAAGLKDARLHDLRRTTASFMISDGASLATVGKTLGHTQPSTTARYARLSDTVQRDALKTTGARMAALRGTSPKVDILKFGK